MWSDGLERWYRAEGRHQLPWRQTTDPWAVLVSEVMLQQTSVARVLPRWAPFLARWPTASACADASLEDVLREWRGLGYPRRARALWLTAQRVRVAGWPTTEVGVRALPGVGVYTARALLAFTDAEVQPSAPPRDINLGRVAARAGLASEAHLTAPSVLDGVLAGGQPPGMSLRDYTYALFDVGSTYCRAQPRCDPCPLRSRCAAVAARAAGTVDVAPPPRRQPSYRGSLRQLRGALLAAVLDLGSVDRDALARAVREVPGATDERVAAALAGLVRDGLVAGLSPLVVE